MIPLKKHYKETAIKELIDSLSLKTPMAAPKINKITLNMGLGEASVDKKILEVALEDLALIAGQKPTITMAKKSVANFKIREGMPIGCKVTLRGDRMYDFLQRLLGIAIPRERDFRGLDSKSFDGRGNYSIGIKEHIIFPEIDY
ncbi:uncharacterized protein METZ01_LOCUS191948, partial [marine metagenome]